MRKLLSSEKIDSKALQTMQSYHGDTIQDIESNLQQHEWVIVGMAYNPFVKKARRALEEKNAPYKYIEAGSYFSQWQRRLAIKLWSGWPTFPQVFHKGKLIGGANDLKKYTEK